MLVTLPIRIGFEWAFGEWGDFSVMATADLRYRDIGDCYRAKHTRIYEDDLQSIFPELPAWPAHFDLFTYSGTEPNETAQWMRWNEFVGHLTMVLLKVDRASMYHSLEVRVPLLDREVIDVASRVDWRSCSGFGSEAWEITAAALPFSPCPFPSPDETWL